MENAPGRMAKRKVSYMAGDLQHIPAFLGEAEDEYPLEAAVLLVLSGTTDLGMLV